MIPKESYWMPISAIIDGETARSIGAIFIVHQATKDSGPPFRWRISRQNMSTSATVGTAILPREDAEKGIAHACSAWMLALAVVLVIAGYGLNTTRSGRRQRPFSPKHELLRPSGSIGIKLGMLGVLMFFLIYLYPLRKKWGWLAVWATPPWLDFHVVLGAAAPVIVAFHSTSNSAISPAWPFYSMLMVTISGFVAAISTPTFRAASAPRKLSMKENPGEREALRKRSSPNRKATFGFAVDALAEPAVTCRSGQTP